MSFLARYWTAVERAVSETGMNPGDIVVDLNEVCKNTDDSNVTEPVVENLNPTPTHPNKDGSMPRYRTDFAAKEILARGAASQSSTIDAMEEDFAKTTATKRSKLREGVDDNETRYGTRTGTSKKATRAERKLKTKTLRKLGGGRKVRVLIDEVTFNGSSIWTTC